MASEFVFALSEEKLVGTLIIGFRDENVGRAVQIAVVWRTWVHILLRGGDAMLFQHHHEQFCFDDRAAEE
jgi:hypothetical protein